MELSVSVIVTNDRSRDVSVPRFKRDRNAFRRMAAEPDNDPERFVDWNHDRFPIVPAAGARFVVESVHYRRLLRAASSLPIRAFAYTGSNMTSTLRMAGLR